MQNIREKLKRRLSHKDESANFDEHDSADEETVDYVNTEAEEAEQQKLDMGKPGSFLNRLIMHGNKKTEDQIAQDYAAASRTSKTTDRQVTQQ